MKNIVFYAPNIGINTLRFIRPVRNLPDVHLIGIGQDSPHYLSQLGHVFDKYIRLENAEDPAQIEDAIRRIHSQYKIDAILNILEFAQQILSRIREKYGIPGIGIETARRFRDKAYMKQILRENDINCANFQRVESLEAAQKFIEQNGLPVVSKPLGGAGAVDTFVINTQEEVIPRLEQMKISPSNPAIIEEFIEGEEGSFDTLTLHGQIKFFSMTTYFPGPMDAMLNPWIQIIFNLNKDIIDHPDYEDVRQAGHSVIKAMGLDTSITHMEWFRRKKDGKIYIGEIAARPPGEPIPGLHNYCHDISLFDAWAKLMVNKEYDLKPERKYHVSCARLRAQGMGTHIREIHNLDIVERKVGHLIIDHRIAPVGAPKTSSYMGESYIFCRGDNFEEVFAATRFITEQVKIFC